MLNDERLSDDTAPRKSHNGTGVACLAQIQDEHYLAGKFQELSLHKLYAQFTVQHYFYNDLDGPVQLATHKGNVSGYSKQPKGVKQEFDA